ncbi:MAG: T9SS type A sorting domain-containing protein [Bacteroidetes bacterium]|nr:T9SS type A sorting domain-containing protein [Bacteroidota bacterium]
MKKITLLAFALLAMSSSEAQNSMKISGRDLSNGKSVPATISASHRNAGQVVTPTVLATIFSEDFAAGLPATWVQNDSTGAGEVWTYAHTGPLNDSILLALKSTSAANGWMMFDDDGYGNNTDVASASLITPAIDCSSNTIVYLTLQEHFRQYNTGSGTIYVSNDSITWTAVHSAETGLAQGETTANPYNPYIDISSIAANQANVYLKFTYRGNWDYYWQIDDIEVFEPSAVDVSAINVMPLNTEYTFLPVSQAANLYLAGDVFNIGSTATSGGTALFEVIDSATNTAAFTETVNLPVIGSFATESVLTTTAFTPTAAATYFVRMTVTLSGDANTGNDIFESATTMVTDSIFGRDNGTSTGALGIGAGPANGIVGQNYTVVTASQVTSVSFFLTDVMTPNPAGSPVWATIRTQAVGSEPSNTILASSDTLIIMPGDIATGGQWFTLPVRSVPSLSPGLYFVGVHEADSLLTLSTSNAILTASAVWASWDGAPSPPAVNGWALASDLGFDIVYQLRLNFGDVSIGVDKLNTLSGFEVYPNPSKGMINISNTKNDNSDYTVNVYNAIGQSVYARKITTASLTTIDLSSQPSGIYQVKITNNSGSFNQSVVIK